MALTLLAAACQHDEGGTRVLAVGDRAPDFRLTSAGGGHVASADFFGHQPVLMYFSMGPG